MVPAVKCVISLIPHIQKNKIKKSEKAIKIFKCDFKMRKVHQDNHIRRPLIHKKKENPFELVTLKLYIKLTMGKTVIQEVVDL